MHARGTCFAASTSALCSISSRTTAAWPFWAARKRPVAPLCQKDNEKHQVSGEGWRGVGYRDADERQLNSGYLINWQSSLDMPPMNHRTVAGGQLAVK